MIISTLELDDDAQFALVKKRVDGKEAPGMADDRDRLTNLQRRVPSHVSSGDHFQAAVTLVAVVRDSRPP